jgi:hypothetical protein
MRFSKAKWRAMKSREAKLIESLFEQGILPKEVCTDAQEELDAGETEIAMHSICDALSENDIRISKSIYEELKVLCEDAGVQARIWEQLLPLVN